MVPVFSDIVHCSGCTCSDCTVNPGSSTLVVFQTFLIFYFPFYQFPAKISCSFLLKLVFSRVIPEVLLHFRYYNTSVVGLPSTKWL